MPVSLSCSAAEPESEPGQVGSRVYTEQPLRELLLCIVLTWTLYGCVGVSSSLRASSPGGERRDIEIQPLLIQRLAVHRETQVNQLFLKCQRTFSDRYYYTLSTSLMRGREESRIITSVVSV